MSHLLFIPLFALGTISTLFGIPAYFFWRNREPISRFFDRHEIPPSRLYGVAQIGGGCMMVVCMLSMDTARLPVTSMVQLFAAAIFIGFGFDKFFRPPKEEYRPIWYVGKGDPTWLPERPTYKYPQISLRWIVIVTFVLGICLAVISGRLKEERESIERNEAAIQQALRLGATITNGSVSFGGITQLGDKDLELISELRGIRDLNLTSTAITNETIQRIDSIEGLNSLFLNETGADDDSLRLLQGCESLQMLHLRKTQVTGRVLPFGRRRPVVALDVSYCPIDAEGLENIAKGTDGALQLFLTGTDVDDSMLETLKSINVRRLDIRETKVTFQAAQAIRASNPRMKVYWNARPTNDSATGR